MAQAFRLTPWGTRELYEEWSGVRPVTTYAPVSPERATALSREGTWIDTLQKLRFCTVLTLMSPPERDHPGCQHCGASNTEKSHSLSRCQAANTRSRLIAGSKDAPVVIQA